MKVKFGSLITLSQNGFASGVRDSEGVVQLRMNNVTPRGGIALDEVIRVPCEPKQLEAYRIEIGDILFNNTNSTEMVGKSGVFEGHPEPVIFSNHFTRLRVHNEKADARYVGYFLNRLWHQGYFREKCQRWIGQSAFKISQMLDLELDCPELSTQRRIVARLKQQMAATAEMRQAVKEQEDAVTPLFERTLAEAFQGITPLSLGIGADAAPSGWQWRRLLDLAKLESGHTPSRRHPEYWENGDIPWLALPDIRTLDCLVAHDTSEHTNKLGIANSSARILPKDTVALSRTASVGFVTRFGRPMATSQDFVNWICGKELDPAFLMWLLRASRKFIRSVSTGAIHQTVYVDVVNRFEVCLPSLATQRAIAARMDECFTHVENLRRTLAEQSEAISALPGAYLGEAFGSAMD